ncbi:acyl carrier protein [Desulfosporosinus sp. PR]|uniref:acyl carrier protein n=1 Tax=Candidatus Desulfosporosinus nitrosoreducens TaxID=3401928 RepID=UPI0027F98176|nr:acyl carrier protein [Desulfosporosinus sp. PR]MDQ7094659.1 acyl carrier protein [Desulfosporosinus sp. PR]
MVFQKVAEILAEILGLDDADIAPETELTGDSGIKAVDLAKLVIECEQAFNIVIHDEDVHNFNCVNKLVEYIERAQSDV